MIRQRIKDLSTGKDVETDKKNIVGEQHKSGESISNSTLSESIESKITNVLNLRVLHDELPHSHGGDPEEDTSDHHGDDTRDPS